MREPKCLESVQTYNLNKIIFFCVYKFGRKVRTYYNVEKLLFRECLRFLRINRSENMSRDNEQDWLCFSHPLINLKCWNCQLQALYQLWTSGVARQYCQHKFRNKPTYFNFPSHISVCCCCRLPKFRTISLPPSSG